MVPGMVRELTDWARIVRLLLSTAAPGSNRRMRQWELAKLIGVTQPAISKYLQGSQPEREDTRERILALARQRNVYYANQSPFRHKVDIIGRVDNQLKVELNPGDVALGEAPMVDHATSTTVALVLEDAAISPALAQPGWIVYYNDNESAPNETTVGHTCVVRLTDGRTLVRRVLRGTKPGFWMLLTPSGLIEDDQQIEWAERIFCIQAPWAN